MQQLGKKTQNLCLKKVFPIKKKKIVFERAAIIN